MDKYELVIDLIDHSENYTSEQLGEILSDPETREIYNLLCKTDSAIGVNRKINVNAEWEVFLHKNSLRPHRFFMWFGSRAASTVAIIFTSIVAVAAAIGVTVAVMDHKDNPKVSSEVQYITEPLVTSSENISQLSDTVKVELNSIMFEDESLEAIMNVVSEVYSVEVKFNNKEVGLLHLYYRFDPSLPLEEVISQLNTFEQINIRQNNNILTID